MNNSVKQRYRSTGWALIPMLLVTFMSGCSINPHNVDIAMEEEVPSRKATNFQQAMIDLGLMSRIYATDKVNVMSQFVADNTGTSVATRAEIPRDITEMVKSTLNGFGGNITYIPYDPDFILNSAQTGYSGFQKKLIPHVVITGGITEFDRGLETRGKNTDLGLAGGVEGEALGFDFSNKTKESVASITLDFNMIDFETMAGIPRMQAVNNIRVRKALSEKGMAFSVNGNTLGLKGSIKKVQGRHAAVRLLVQVSMIELLGKYMQLPYWRLLDSAPDPVVLASLKADFYAMTEQDRIDSIQQLLILNGYDVSLNGQLREDTQEALQTYGVENNIAAPAIDEETYISLYSTVPITHKVLQKRRLMASYRQEEGSAVANNNTTLSSDGLLRMTTNRTAFNIGDQVAISLEVTQPLYVAVLNVSSTGKVWHLFPESSELNQRLTPGVSYQIPPASAPYQLEIIGPSGTDQLIAIGSTKPLPDAITKVSFKDDLPTDLLASMTTRVNTEIHIK